MTDKVVGYLVDPTLNLVMLILKQRPEWMRGLYNGVGGKIEPGESPLQTMERECLEESGLVTRWDTGEWEAVARLDTPNGRIFVFAAIGTPTDGATTTDEEIIVANVAALPPSIVPNVRWLIPLALQTLRGERAPATLVATYV